MSDSDIVDLTRQAIWLTIMVGGPVMLVGLVVGVVVALFQALTQIQEMTLVFVPKILSMFAAMFILFPVMVITLTDFMHQIADRIVGIQ